MALVKANTRSEHEPLSRHLGKGANTDETPSSIAKLEQRKAQKTRIFGNRFFFAERWCFMVVASFKLQYSDNLSWNGG